MSQPVTKPPYRSPKAVSEAIKDLIKDKTVCELGCAEGDNLVFMSQYAKHVVGFEYMERRYRVAQQRGLDVVVGDYYRDELPDADVYYFWPDDGERDSEYLVQKLLNKPNFKGTIIVGGDPGFPAEIPSLHRCAKLGKLTRVPYNEGDGPREHGIYELAIIDSNSLQQQCTFVLSSPRAGSSCTTAILQLCGLSIGNNPTTVKDQFNAKGYFENQTLLSFHEKVLRTVGSSIFATQPLTRAQEIAASQFKNELVQILRQEFPVCKFFMIKDPRVNILQNLYSEALSELNIKKSFVILSREKDHACKSMHQMTGIPLEAAANSYELHYRLANQFAGESPTTRVAFSELVANPNVVAKRMCFELNIPYGVGRHNAHEVINFVERKLINHG